jgi:hypothetical protein
MITPWEEDAQEDPLKNRNILFCFSCNMPSMHNTGMYDGDYDILLYEIFVPETFVPLLQ